MILALKNLTIKQNNKELIKSFSHDFSLGEIYALVGNNGTGKTTLLRTLAGLHKDIKGQILLAGQKLASLPNNVKANNISFLLQHSPEQPYCTAFSRIAHGLMPIFGYNFNPDKKTTLIIEEIAKELNIYHLLHRKLAHLSGGEQRLVHIAKCLINPHTKIVLLDEPSVFLDFTQTNNLGKILQARAQKGQLIIFSAHDAHFIERFAHKVISIREIQRSSSFNALESKKEMAFSIE